jgi:broad specificity phosphatase PhoE
LYSDVVKRAAAVPLLLVLLAAFPVSAQEAIYIVRHAEREDQSADSALSTAGIGRSYKLRDALRDAGVTRIFTSELRRTIDTAAPLAAAIKVTPQQISGGDTAALATRIGASDARDRVLVVGHSNTVPALLAALHVEPSIAIGDDEYDNLFIVVPQRDGRPVLLRLKY